MFFLQTGSFTAMTGTVAAPRPRDPRLDFFRGVAMLIIFIAHMPGNTWNLYIPARFGWSDATEMFVFCSGFAAAIAFGGTFSRLGFWTGTARVAYRIWQLWYCHLGLFIVIAMIVAMSTEVFDTRNYVTQLNLQYFFDETGRALFHYMTLTYVPNLFDILPMYMGALALMPVVVLLARRDPKLAIAFVVGLYLINFFVINLNPSAEPWSDRGWFFNPFAWQLLFFTGFAIAIGWIKAPGFHPVLFWGAVAFVVASIPLNFWMIYRNVEIFQEIRTAIWLPNGPGSFEDSLRSKTQFGLLRYIHFLCLAYITVCLLRGHEQVLNAKLFRPIVKVGQQALPTFLASIVLSRIGGILLDQTVETVGEDRPSQLWVAALNIAGMATLIVLAYVVAYFKKRPWLKKPAPPASETTPGQQAPAPRPAGAHPMPAE